MPEHKHRYESFREEGRLESSLRCVGCLKYKNKEDEDGGIIAAPQPVEIGGTGFARAEDNAPVEDPSGAEDGKPSK